MAEKFLLPDGGRILVDPELRALDETMPLQLPYPVVALEYSMSASHSKRIVLARQEQDFPDWVMIRALYWKDGFWHAFPLCGLPRTSYLDSASREIVISGPGDYPDEMFPREEVSSLMLLLNMLSCSNVKTERVTQKQSSKRGALPFDSYRLLMIEQRLPDKAWASAGGSHRSPREHLRRGHIRRYENGLKIWVNASVVNLGAAGRVEKTYAFKAHPLKEVSQVAASEIPTAMKVPSAMDDPHRRDERSAA